MPMNNPGLGYGFNLAHTQRQGRINGGRCDNLPAISAAMTPTKPRFPGSRLKHFRKHRRWSDDATEENRQNLLHSIRIK